MTYALNQSFRYVFNASSGVDTLEIVQLTDMSLTNDDARLRLLEDRATSENDTIFGYYTANILEGGLGDDVLTGGRGNDDITRGSGSDTAIFANGDGQDAVFSFAGTGDIDTLWLTDNNIADAIFLNF